MANKHRGEVNIQLCGSKYTLRPTFEALCELEDRAGQPVLTIMAGMEGGKIRLKDMALIIWAGMYGYDQSSTPSIEKVGEMILKTGLLNVMQEVDDRTGINPISEFLMNGILGGEDPVEEDADVAKKPKKKAAGEAKS